MLTSKYWQRSVKDVQESINQQKASGKWLTETQQESIVKFRELNRQLSQLSDARQVAFVDGFMKSLDPKVTEEFMKTFLISLRILQSWEKLQEVSLKLL